MRQGYQIYATSPFKGPIASSTDAETPGEACEKCFINFPTEEGYTEHSVKNLETRGQYSCKKKESVEAVSMGEGMPEGPYTVSELFR